MRPIHDANLTTLTWSKSGLLGNLYELKAGDELIGNLNWVHSRRRSPGETHSIARCAEGSWTFEFSRILQPKVKIRDTGSHKILAQFNGNLYGCGTLDYPGGPSFSWCATDHHGINWEFFGPGRERLLRITHLNGRLRARSQIEILAPVQSVPELPLLCFLSWYLILETSAYDRSPFLPLRSHHRSFLPSR